ncbi:MAG: GIY-YIG nuclease family protein [Candidatus Azambacteria bacterium]|nr:GIY-YIG nuclease family protein [Candidatus Azambacteria bacterium]
MEYYLYIIKSLAIKRFYIGITSNLEKRIKEHNAGKTKSAKPYIPWALVYKEIFPNKTLARKREIFLKKNYQERSRILSNL